MVRGQGQPEPASLLETTPRLRGVRPGESELGAIDLGRGEKDRIHELAGQGRRLGQERLGLLELAGESTDMPEGCQRLGFRLAVADLASLRDRLLGQLPCLGRLAAGRTYPGSRGAGLGGRYAPGAASGHPGLVQGGECPLELAPGRQHAAEMSADPRQAAGIAQAAIQGRGLAEVRRRRAEIALAQVMKAQLIVSEGLEAEIVRRRHVESRLRRPGALTRRRGQRERPDGRSRVPRGLGEDTGPVIARLRLGHPPGKSGDVSLEPRHATGPLAPRRREPIEPALDARAASLSQHSIGQLDEPDLGLGPGTRRQPVIDGGFGIVLGDRRCHSEVEGAQALGWPAASRRVLEGGLEQRMEDVTVRSLGEQEPLGGQRVELTQGLGGREQGNERRCAPRKERTGQQVLPGVGRKIGEHLMADVFVERLVGMEGGRIRSRSHRDACWPASGAIVQSLADRGIAPREPDQTGGLFHREPQLLGADLQVGHHVGPASGRDPQSAGPVLDQALDQIRGQGIGSIEHDQKIGA